MSLAGIVTGGLIGNPIISKFSLSLITIIVTPPVTQNVGSGGATQFRSSAVIPNSHPYKKDDEEYPYVNITIKINNTTTQVSYEVSNLEATILVKYLHLVDKYSSIEDVKVHIAKAKLLSINPIITRIKK